ncbi:MAG: ISAs1 family transposase [Thermomicrobiales bacterium]
MCPHPAPRIAECFADLVDPRIDRTKRHQLLDIITIAVCAVISGAESWVEVADWDRAKQAWLADWLEVPHGVPSHDTFGRVLARLDPAQFEASFVRWVQAVAGTAEPEVIALDGKTIRRSGDGGVGTPPLHLISAWATRQRLVLTQEAVDTKDNEIVTLPALLARLDLTGQTVTIDAIGCQRELAAQIVDGGGDYVLDVAFREDESRVRTGHSAQNLAVLRRLALTLIRQDRSRTVGVKASRLRAGWETGYLLHLLGAR